MTTSASVASPQLEMLKRLLRKRGQKFLIGPGVDYVAERKRFASPRNQLPPTRGVAFIPEVLGGVPVELASPTKVAGDAVVLYIHGGGYIYGDAVTSRGYASALADESNLRVYSVSYRLAPEYKFPCGVEDCFSVYCALLERHPSGKIALVGESSGGTFVLVVTLMAKDRNVPLPACICVFSPCTNLAEDPPSRRRNAQLDFIVPYENLNELLRSVYLGGETDPKYPYVSPFFGDYVGFPPMKVTVDSGEVLFDDAAWLVEKARAAGVEVDYQVLNGTFHALPVIGRTTPESSKILRETAMFIRKHCGV